MAWLSAAASIANIISSLASSYSALKGSSAPGSGLSGSSEKSTVGKEQPFQVSNPFEGRPLLGNTGRLSEKLLGENSAFPQGKSSMSPFQQNELRQELSNAMRGK